MRVAVPLVLLISLAAALIYPSIIGALLAGYQIYAAAVSPLLLLAVAGGSLRAGLLAIGIPVSLAGMIDFGVALVFVSLRETVVLPWLTDWMQWLYPSGLAALLTPAIASLIGRFFLSALIWSGAAVLAGAVLIVLSRLVKR